MSVCGAEHLCFLYGPIVFSSVMDMDPFAAAFSHEGAPFLKRDLVSCSEPSFVIGKKVGICKSGLLVDLLMLPLPLL